MIGLSGECILDIDVLVGYLHRGSEKPAEYKLGSEGIGHTDRSDHVSVTQCEYGHVRATEMV